MHARSTSAPHCSPQHHGFPSPGDWHPKFETACPPLRPHFMRVMLVSNIAVENRFANGTQGRLMNWLPERASEDGRKALLSSHPELLARFVKETSLNKAEFHPDIDFMDITVRQESLNQIAGAPLMLQLPMQPCYGMTIHKTQATVQGKTRRGPSAPKHLNTRMLLRTPSAGSR